VRDTTTQEGLKKWTKQPTMRRSGKTHVRTWTAGKPKGGVIAKERKTDYQVRTAKSKEKKGWCSGHEALRLKEIAGSERGEIDFGKKGILKKFSILQGTKSLKNESHFGRGGRVVKKNTRWKEKDGCKAQRGVDRLIRKKRRK